MKIINIGTDENILVDGSRSFLRVRDYAELASETIYLIFTKNKSFQEINENVDGKIFRVVPILGNNKFMQVLRLFKWFKGEFSNTDSVGTDSILSSQDAFEVGLLAYLLCRRYGLKLLLQIHTDISSRYFSRESLRNFFQFSLARFLLSHADAIRVVSNKMKNYLSNNLKISTSKIFLLPIYTDISKFEFISLKLRQPREDGRIRILMLSRIEEVKNIPLGIQAVQAYRKLSRRDIELRIVGKGGLKQKYLKMYRNRDWLDWADWTDDVSKEYHQADLLLITSNYEGWGLTAVESVACGTPVAISPVGVANEFVVNGVNGFVASGHDVVNISEVIHYCLEHEFQDNQMKKSLESLGHKQSYLSRYALMLRSMV